MRAAINNGDVEELESATDHRAIAERLMEWAQRPHPDDELSSRELLTRAGEQLELAEDDAGALALYRRALAMEGEAILDARSHMISLLLQRDEEDEAKQLDRELRRSKPSGAELYHYLGEIWQEHGDVRRALGWYTRGILQHEEGPGFSPSGLGMICLSRWRLRELEGQEPDDYDLIGIGLRERMQGL